jgi:hypothetical protein
LRSNTIRDRLLELFGLGERDYDLGERGSEVVDHVAEQDGVPHLQPGLRTAHPAAVATREHEQCGLHQANHRQL